MTMNSPTLWREIDRHLFNEGREHRAYRRLGAHPVAEGDGFTFSVWAPSARAVSVVGDFNAWTPDKDHFSPVGQTGVWCGSVAAARAGHHYKFVIDGADGRRFEKADPFAFWSEVAPRTASRLFTPRHEWRDGEWMRDSERRQGFRQAMSIYELHLGSWRRRPEDGNRSLTYRELANELPAYVRDAGFTHVEFLPVMEHPFYGSWGYQTTGYFAPSSRQGDPDDFAFLIDELHRAGIGVILDWVPSHFPADAFALAEFDGTHLFEHQDPRQGFHPDWNSLIFNYGRNEVRSFLISSAMYWLDRFHIDGLRVDAVASMLYLDYSRRAGEWVPNRFGGRENLEAIQFLRELNEAVYSAFPDVHMIAEESTAWPRVSSPTYLGGLGFGMKWDMGWMHDTLQYFSKESVYRKFHQNLLTFRSMYAFSENFVLSISHDEVVYGKGSVIGKMSGDEWQKFANARALYANMYAQPGKKLLFMGCEFGQRGEWGHERSLDWHELDHDPYSRGLFRLVGDLNRVYREEPALHDGDFDAEGFRWVDAGDTDNSVLSFLRISKGGERILCVFNLTPVPRDRYRLGVPVAGEWREILNTDANIYGGGDIGNGGLSRTEGIATHGFDQSLSLTLPPLGALYLKSPAGSPTT